MSVGAASGKDGKDINNVRLEVGIEKNPVVSHSDSIVYAKVSKQRTNILPQERRLLPLQDSQGFLYPTLHLSVKFPEMFLSGGLYFYSPTHPAIFPSRPFLSLPCRA